MSEEKRKFGLWAKTDCDFCGIEFQVTRTNEKEFVGEVICSECEIYRRAYKDGYDSVIGKLESGEKSVEEVIDDVLSLKITEAINTGNFMIDTSDVNNDSSEDKVKGLNKMKKHACKITVSGPSGCGKTIVMDNIKTMLKNEPITKDRTNFIFEELTECHDHQKIHEVGCTVKDGVFDFEVDVKKIHEDLHKAQREHFNLEPKLTEASITINLSDPYIPEDGEECEARYLELPDGGNPDWVRGEYKGWFSNEHWFLGEKGMVQIYEDSIEFRSLDFSSSVLGDGVDTSYCAPNVGEEYIFSCTARGGEVKNAKGTVKYLSNYTCVMDSNHVKGEFIAHPDTMKFRHPKTERDFAIGLALSIDCEPHEGMLNRTDFVGAMYDAGWRPTK